MVREIWETAEIVMLSFLSQIKPRKFEDDEPAIRANALSEKRESVLLKDAKRSFR
jgi:hypothetical protein